jgi:hypothetical protein
MKVLNRTTCECGEKINGSNMKPPLFTPAQLGLGLDFYGGRAKRIIKAVCKCGKEYYAMLKPANNGFDVIDLANYKTVDEVKPTPKHYICKQCGAKFDNPAKVASHMKKYCKGAQ